MVLLLVLLKIYLTVGQNLHYLQGHARQDVHVGSEIPLGKFLPIGILWWISTSTLTILPWPTAWISRPFNQH